MTSSAAPASAAEPGNRERTPPAIAAKGICKSFATQVLRNVDLRVTPGTIHGLVGENGAGKSTLAKIVVGLEQPDSGSLSLAGAPYQPRSASDSLKAWRRFMRPGTQPHRRSLHRRQPAAPRLVGSAPRGARTHPPQARAPTCYAVTGTRWSRTREPGHASRPAESRREAACGACQSPRHGRRPTRAGRTHLRPHRTAVAPAARSPARAGECRSDRDLHLTSLGGRARFLRPHIGATRRRGATDAAERRAFRGGLDSGNGRCRCGLRGQRTRPGRCLAGASFRAQFAHRRASPPHQLRMSAGGNPRHRGAGRFRSNGAVAGDLRPRQAAWRGGEDWMWVAPPSS